MKAPYILLGLWGFCLHAQNTSTSLPTPGYVITQRALNSRVWQEPLVTTNVDGTVSTNISAYTEVRSGLCYMNEGVLVDSSDEIDLVADGAQAVHGQHSVHWMANLNAPGGAVRLVTAGGQVLQSAVFGISYWDTSTGTNLLLGAVLDSQGTLIGNQVVYSNAFKGSSGAGINADVAYIYSVEGLEQNVVFRQQLPDPSSLGLDPVHTYLQVLTEFFNPPVPFQQSLVTDGVTNDMFLNFGDMSMGMGQAFLASTNGGVSTAGSVQKQWTTIENRTFLIEQIPYSQVSGLQQELPAHASISKPAQRISRLAALREKPSLKPPQDFGALKLASAYSAQPGLVIDYSIVNSVTNMTFQQGSTYYLSGNVSLSGTNTFEGGAVIKFTNNASITENAGPLTPQVNFLTGPYRPLICTAKDDNSVGQPINGSTGNPFTNYYANPALALNDISPAVTNVRVSFAKLAISASPGSPTFRDAQFVNCSNGVSVLGGTLTIENALFANVEYPFYSIGSGGVVIAKNITVNGSAYLLTLASTNSGESLTFTNSIFSQVTNLTGYPANSPSSNYFPLTSSDFNGFYETTSFGSDIASNGIFPFQTVGAGSYYLTNTSGLTSGGTLNVDAALLTDLAQKTVYPPTIVSNLVISSATIWAPSVPRDNTPGSVAFGYHYSPLDYLCSQLTISSALVLTNGTAAALFGTVGFYPLAGGVSSYGNANTLNQLVWYPSVQEQGLELSGAAPPGNAMFSLSNGAPNFLTLNFTEVSMIGARQPLLAAFNAANAPILTAKNCQWHAVDFSMSSPPASPFITAQITLQNNLFERCSFSLYNQITNTFEAPLNLSVYNNLFWSNTVTLVYSNIAGLSTAWTVCDNLLDGCGDSFVTNNVTPNYNAFHNSSVFGGPNNVSLTALTYATGPLGNRYTNSSTPTLINMGSRSAPAAGLYHYTMSTNLLDGLEIPETNTTVDIGFHYVATDAYGNPLDTDNDGLPDYIKDANGDGLFDAGDLFNWQFPFYIYDQGKTYGGYTPKNLRLGYWRFNNSSLTNQAGQTPSYTNGLTLSNSFSGTAVSVNQAGASSQLMYNEMTNGQTLFDPANGTLRFYYQPNWTTGSAQAPAGGITLFRAGLYAAGLSDLSVVNAGSTNCGLLQFVTESNQFYQSHSFQNSFYTGALINFQSNLWYQIALTYSPSNIAIYTNGALLATACLSPTLETNKPFTNGPMYELGNGVSFYPNASDLSSGLCFGNLFGQTTAIMGQLDEFETFNYPLTAKAIAYGFPTFGGNPTNMLDSYYIGRSDMLQSYVDGLSPNPTNLTPCRLGYWRFDTPDLIGEQGQVPLSSANVTLVPSWSGTALNISSAASSHVTYPDVSSNGWANINCRHGAVRFWYKPNAIGVSGTFLYMGTASGSDAWTLNLNSGDTISFDTQTNEMGYTPVIDAHVAPLSPSKWTQIVLTYSATNCTLFINGTNAGSSSGNANWPSPSNRALGIVVGNAAGLSSPINGQIDELETFNYQLAASDISNNFQLVANVDSDLNGIPDLLEDIHLSTSRPFLGAPVVITGTLEAEQFDTGSNGVAYQTSNPVATNTYRPSRMIITPCNDLGGGYCLDQTHANEWAQYSINVRVPQTYMVEVRAQPVGTNLGGTFQCDFTNGIGVLTNAAGISNSTGPLAIANTNWTNISKVVYLPTNATTMRLHFLSNATNGTGNVGCFNYISIYPWWQAGFTSTTNINVTGLTSNVNTYTVASNNAFQIQSAINSLPSTGGTVSITNGIYYVAQASPNEMNGAWANAAVSILGSNIEIAGTGKASTTLIGYNRATTVFTAGWGLKGGMFSAAQVTNITLRDMTIEGQPHWAVANMYGTNIAGTNIVYDPGQLLPGPYSTNDLNTNVLNGANVGVSSVFWQFLGSQWPYNILITNCQFLYGWNPITLAGNDISNILVRACDFTMWGGPITNFGNVGIMAGADNLVVVENTYNGNTNLTTVNTNNNSWNAPAGLVWIQYGGNFFAARNNITNYLFEAVQVNAGPNSVVENTFYTLISDESACALDAFGAARNQGVTGFPGDLSTCFVGNSVYGGRQGAEAPFQPGQTGVPYVLNFSGNTLTLYPPFDQGGDSPGAAVGVGYCLSANVCGNTLVSGGHGFVFAWANSNALVLNNNFSGATYRGIGYGSTGDSLNTAQIFGNTLGQGVTFHAQVPYANSFGWFFKTNTYLTSASNSVAPFFDPVESLIHQ